MLLAIRGVLGPDDVREARGVLSDAPWADGRLTAGEQSAVAKNNQQLPEATQQTRTLQQLVLRGLERHPTFFSAALPKQVSPPLFNRYGGASNSFADHVDASVRYLPDGRGIRTDISCTLFLADASDYDGGELVIDDTFGAQRVKLDAGDLVLYPGTSVHRVEPVTHGVRLASYFWVQSMVRSDEHRRLLFDMDRHLMKLRTEIGEADPAVVGLTGTYHNLLRMWIDV